MIGFYEIRRLPEIVDARGTVSADCPFFRRLDDFCLLCPVLRPCIRPVVARADETFQIAGPLFDTFGKHEARAECIDVENQDTFVWSDSCFLNAFEYGFRL